MGRNFLNGQRSISCARKSASRSTSVRLKRSPVVLEVFALVLSFLLLASQGAALSHSHSDLHLHPDCNLCLKLGSNDDVLPAVSSEIGRASCRERADKLGVDIALDEMNI